MNLKAYFFKSHPFQFNWKSLVIPFLITVFILMVFKPFEFSAYTSFFDLLLWSVIFGFIASLSVFSVIALLKWLFPKMMSKENWTVGKELLLILLVILVIVLVIFVLFWVNNPGMNLFKTLIRISTRTLAISIFPVMILLLYEQYYYKKTRLSELQNSEYKQIESSENQDKEKVVITSENQKDVFKVDSDKLVYLKSEGNYVELFYLHNNAVHKELIRNRLKVLESNLPERSFFRCHKSYIVNLHHILKVQGNSRNMELLLNQVNEKIPVSRTSAKTLLQIINPNH